MAPDISIIIPCYNHGRFIREALESIPRDQGIEVIIINDGSTDQYTLTILSELASEGYSIIHQENQGLGRTRNNGIKASSGKYILPLDADNKLLETYFTKGVALLDSHPGIAVVYSDAIYFGDRQGDVKPGDFNLQQLITGNYIDACALYRRSAWEAVGGYDEHMPFMGVEDWELWLNMSFHGFKFHYINEPGYYYRVSNNSMIKKDTSPNYTILRTYVEHKHSYYLNYSAPAEFIANKFKANPFVLVFKLILLSYFPGKYNEMVKSGRIKRL